MRKPRGGQILANRVIGPREVLGGGDRRVPSKGRGRTEPHRGRSGASWIWSTPLHTGASEGEFRSGYALTPSPSHSKNISLFTERRTSERTVSEDGYSSFLFNPLWGFPVVAAGILFVVDHLIALFELSRAALTKFDLALQLPCRVVGEDEKGAFELGLQDRLLAVKRQLLPFHPQRRRETKIP